MNVFRALGAAALGLAAASSVQATELFSPALPASSAQHLECRILNASPSKWDVMVEARDSNGVVVTATPLTLAPGEAGGFAIPGWYAGMYCRFETKGPASDFRASIDVFEVNAGGNFRLVVALPAN